MAVITLRTLQPQSSVYVSQLLSHSSLIIWQTIILICACKNTPPHSVADATWGPLVSYLKKIRYSSN